MRKSAVNASCAWVTSVGGGIAFLMLCVTSPFAALAQDQEQPIEISTSVGTYAITNRADDVSTIDDYEALLPLIESQVWWGNSALAEEFAQAYASTIVEPPTTGFVTFAYGFGCQGPVAFIDNPDCEPEVDGQLFTKTIVGFAVSDPGDVSYQGWAIPPAGECCAVAKGPPLPPQVITSSVD